MSLPLLPTALVGSYPQPDWLIDRKRLSTMVPRVRMSDLWRFEAKELEAKQDEATLLAIREQECAGLDIVTDGEQRRESYSNHFATALAGVDTENPGITINRNGKPIPVPRITGKVKRETPVEMRALQFLRANTAKPVKMTVPGPFTMSMQAQNEFYKTAGELALDYAAAVNEEIKDLFAAGCDIVQIDEPWMQQHPDKARAFGLTALSRALDGVAGPVVVHLCLGYAAVVRDKPPAYSFLTELEGSQASQVSIEAAQPKLDLTVLEKFATKTANLGVIDLSDMTVETPETVAARIRKALQHIAAERLVIVPDCGMKYLPHDVAYGKMAAMVEGTKIVRAGLA
jgi:5-methyltetrahydropteroyltriglutamate--homocysteine methyltransferase